MNDIVRQKQTYLLMNQIEYFHRNLRGIIWGKGKNVMGICKQTGIPVANFYRRLKKQTFTAGELKRIIEAINE